MTVVQQDSFWKKKKKKKKNINEKKIKQNTHEIKYYWDVVDVIFNISQY